MSIAITGASGQVGRMAAESLLNRVPPSDLVLVTRHPDSLADLSGRGAEVRAGDFDDPATLSSAFSGVERLLLISTDAVGRRAEQHLAAIDAATEAGVRHVVYTSMPNPVPGNPVGILADEHRATEEALRASGLTWTVLRNGMYAEFQVPTGARAAASGRLVTTAGDGRTAYVSRDDCAAVAAAVLATDGHEGLIYDITGPELLGAADVAAILTEVTDRPVEVISVDDETYIQGLTEGGMPTPAAKAVAGWSIAIRGGYLDQLGTAVHALTGRAARSLREVFTGHRHDLLPSD